MTHGAGKTLLTLTGSNFLPGVAITWNGSYRTTTIVDATHVTIALTAADIASAGTASAVATNPGVPASAALTVTINLKGNHRPFRHYADPLCNGRHPWGSFSHAPSQQCSQRSIAKPAAL
jgi:hypothetical protein